VTGSLLSVLYQNLEHSLSSVIQFQVIQKRENNTASSF